MRSILIVAISFLFLIQGNEEANKDLDYCTEVAKEAALDTTVQVNLTISSVDNKTYCVDGGTREAFFNLIAHEEQYVYLSEHYCANLQNYPITCEQYYNAEIYDSKAKANYQKLYADYHATGVPNSDCLGIARFVFCAEQFKYCNSDDGNNDYEICSFLCQIWQNRCPDYTDIYNRVCSGGGGTGLCSFGRIISIFLILTYVFIY